MKLLDLFQKEKSQNKEYTFISENTTKWLSLHDCCCSRFHYENNNLIFEMEWIEVLANHPLNPNEKAYQSGVAQMVFVAPQIIECELAENKYIGNELVSRKIVRVEDLDFCDTEFLIYDEKENDNKCIAKMFLIFDDDTYYNSLVMEIEFEKSIVKWNELISTSWFEREG